MEIASAIVRASRKVCYEFRCWSCEVLAWWSLRLAPAGYVPSYVEAVVRAGQREGAPVRGAQSERRCELEREIAEIAARHKRAFEEEIAPLLAELALTQS